VTLVPRVLLAGLAALALATGAACAQGASTPAPGLHCYEDGAPQSGLPREQITISTARGPVRLNLQLADDDATREKGLMFVRRMADDEGMIFDFQESKPVWFWMRNTYISLDLLFVDAEGRIVNIAERARPCDDSPIPSAGPIRAVIEINAGLAERLGIRPGDQVTGQRIFPAR